MSTDKSRDLGGLKARLDQLDITVSEHEDGRLTVYTTNEPLFCFTRHSKEEIEAIVKETLISYVTTFYHVDSVEVSAVNEPIKQPSIPLERARPVSKIRPNFSAPNWGGQLVCA